MPSYLTSKTFPQKLQLTPDEIFDIINAPMKEMEKSELLSNDQTMIDLIVETMPPNLSMELSRDISKIRDVFQELVENDERYAKLVKEAASRVGSVREATRAEEDEEQQKIKDQQNIMKQAEEALNKAKVAREGK